MAYLYDNVSGRTSFDPYARKYQIALQSCANFCESADRAEKEKDDIGFYRIVKEINRLVRGPLNNLHENATPQQLNKLKFDEVKEKADKVIARARDKIDCTVVKLQKLANRADATDDLETLQKIVHKITTLNTSEKLSFFKAKKDLKAMPANILEKYKAKIVVLESQLPDSGATQTAHPPFSNNQTQAPQQILPQHVAPSTTPPASKNTQTTTTTTASVAYEDHEIRQLLNCWTNINQPSVSKIEELWDALSQKIPENSTERSHSYELRKLWKEIVEIRLEHSQELNDLNNLAKTYLNELEHIFLQESSWYSFDATACNLMRRLSSTLYNSPQAADSELMHLLKTVMEIEKSRPEHTASFQCLFPLTVLSENYYPQKCSDQLRSEWDSGLRSKWNESVQRCRFAQRIVDKLQGSNDREALLEHVASLIEQNKVFKTFLEAAGIDLNANSAAPQSPPPAHSAPKKSSKAEKNSPSAQTAPAAPSAKPVVSIPDFKTALSQLKSAPDKGANGIGSLWYALAQQAAKRLKLPDCMVSGLSFRAVFENVVAGTKTQWTAAWDQAEDSQEREQLLNDAHVHIESLIDALYLGSYASFLSKTRKMIATQSATLEDKIERLTKKLQKKNFVWPQRNAEVQPGNSEMQQLALLDKRVQRLDEEKDQLGQLHLNSSLADIIARDSNDVRQMHLRSEQYNILRKIAATYGIQTP